MYSHRVPCCGQCPVSSYEGEKWLGVDIRGRLVWLRGFANGGHDGGRTAAPLRNVLGVHETTRGCSAAQQRARRGRARVSSSSSTRMCLEAKEEEGQSYDEEVEAQTAHDAFKGVFGSGDG